MSRVSGLVRPGSGSVALRWTIRLARLSARVATIHLARARILVGAVAVHGAIARDRRELEAALAGPAGARGIGLLIGRVIGNFDGLLPQLNGCRWPEDQRWQLDSAQAVRDRLWSEIQRASPAAALQAERGLNLCRPLMAMLEPMSMATCRAAQRRYESALKRLRSCAYLQTDAASMLLGAVTPDEPMSLIPGAASPVLCAAEAAARQLLRAPDMPAELCLRPHEPRHLGGLLQAAQQTVVEAEWALAAVVCPAAGVASDSWRTEFRYRTRRMSEALERCWQDERRTQHGFRDLENLVPELAGQTRKHKSQESKCEGSHSSQADG